MQIITIYWCIYDDTYYIYILDSICDGYHQSEYLRDVIRTELENNIFGMKTIFIKEIL
jgi:hypothetical protein